MGINKDKIGAKMRLFMVKAMIKDRFEDKAEVTFNGRRFKVKVETGINKNKDKINVTIDSGLLFPLLAVSDADFERRSIEFVEELVNDARKQVQKAAACQVLDSYFWVW